MGEWIFEPQRGLKRGPQEAELFKSEQTAEGEYAGNDALVREILQNAIDARTPGETLRLRLAVHEATDAPSASALATYFGRLRSPLEQRNVEFDLHGQPNIACRFLVCEDFGTGGLEGDHLLNQDPVPGARSRQDFYWFWRNIGRSGKTGEDLGRWGLGKTVYRAASQAGTMFGLTVRKSDNRALLMGQAVLQIHTHDGREYVPEGYWCERVDESGLALPITSGEELERFRSDWKLSRTMESGLSVVAPYIHPEINAARLLEAVAVNFFLRIVRGDLVVEVVGRDLPMVRLDQSTIEDACTRMDWTGPKRMKRHTPPPIAFTRRCLKLSSLPETLLLGRDKVPELDADAFSEQLVHEMRRDFAAGELVSARVRVWLPTLKGGGQEGFADVHVRRSKDGSTCESYYIREGMTITKISSPTTRRGIQSLVLVEPGPLAELLGDTEGPAHEDWHTSSDRPSLRWKTWKGRVKFARRIVDNFVELLTPPVTEPDFDLLSDFFSIDRVTSPQRRPKAGDEREDRPAFDTITPGPPPWFILNARAGGFTIGRNKGVAVPKGAKLRVTAAYDLPSGDPVRNWSPFDFEFTLNGKAGIVPRGAGLTPEEVAGNSMLLAIAEEDFKLLVEGFDRYRDLYIRVEDESLEVGEGTE